MNFRPKPDVVLAPYCTLGVGGPARWFVEAGDEDTLVRALAWAKTRRLPLRVLGGGSNLVVSDAGVDALVVRVALRGLTTRATDEHVEVTAAAGIVAGGSVHVRDSAIGLLLTPHFEGQGVRVLLSPPAAFAFGAGAALVLSLVGLWRRRT